MSNAQMENQPLLLSPPHDDDVELGKHVHHVSYLSEVIIKDYLSYEEERSQKLDKNYLSTKNDFRSTNTLTRIMLFNFFRLLTLSFHFLF
jgi:hypothetical protein